MLYYLSGQAAISLAVKKLLAPSSDYVHTDLSILQNLHWMVKSSFYTEFSKLSVFEISLLTQIYKASYQP